MYHKNKLEQRSIQLPQSVIAIIEDAARLKGVKFATACRTRILEHMLATDEIFVCKLCGAYCNADNESDPQDVCVDCNHHDAA